MSEPNCREMVPAFACEPWPGFAAPNGRFVAMLEAFRATGGTAPGEIVARLLDEHQIGEAVSLAKLIHTGQVFGFE